MGLRYENLDEEVRRYMVEEIDSDTQSERLYLSNYLNDGGRAAWPQLLREAARAGTDDSFANSLRLQRAMKEMVERRKPSGGYTMVRVPVTAHETLAEAQFNQYYMRALSRAALAHGVERLEVYRAKAVERPRAESERMIGTYLSPQVVLDELRRTIGVEPELGLPLPNSGLCLRLA